MLRPFFAPGVLYGSALDNIPQMVNPALDHTKIDELDAEEYWKICKLYYNEQFKGNADEIRNLKMEAGGVMKPKDNIDRFLVQEQELVTYTGQFLEFCLKLWKADKENVKDWQQLLSPELLFHYCEALKIWAKGRMRDADDKITHAAFFKGV